MLDWLTKDPLGFLSFMLFRAPAVLIALVLHEFAHAYVAFRCGDPTAERMGRLSLNPLRHLDVVGTICMFLLGFGWARPVPVNPYMLRRPRRDDVLVSLAGVTVNFALFLIGTILSILMFRLLFLPSVIAGKGNIEGFLSFRSDLFFAQLLPQYTQEIKGIMKYPALLGLYRFVLHFCMINLGLCLFNLLPVPPLDGFHVVNQLVFKGRLDVSGTVLRGIQFVLLFVLLRSGLLGDVISKAIDAVQGVVLSGLLKVLV